MTNVSTRKMIKRKCPNCGEVVESKFCTSCGHDLTAPDIVKICPKCGTETTAKFCTGCGTKLLDGPSEVVKADMMDNVSDDSISASALLGRAKKIGAQKVKDLEKNAEEKRALKEREAEDLRKKQEKEAEQRRLQELREEEERQRQLEKARQEAQHKAELERKKKLIEQKRVYEEASTYLETAAKTEDHEVSAQFYRKAEGLFSSIPEVEDAGEKSLFAARKAKEQELFIEEERIKADQKANEAAAVKADEEAKRVEARQKALVKNINSEGGEISVAERPETPSPMQEISETKATPPEKVPGKSKSKVIIAVVAAAALVVAGIVFGLSRNGSDDSQPIETTMGEESDQIVEDANAPEDYTTEERNCYETALSYLTSEDWGYSKQGIINQLSSEAEQYPKDVAEKVINDMEKAGTVDWDEQCRRCALSYLNSEDSGFSREGIIAQLTSESEQFPEQQVNETIDYIEKEGLVDWDDQCRKCAQSYIDSGGFSKVGLIEQLTSEAEGFSQEQAEKAVEAVYK